MTSLRSPLRFLIVASVVTTFSSPCFAADPGTAAPPMPPPRAEFVLSHGTYPTGGVITGQCVECWSATPQIYDLEYNEIPGEFVLTETDSHLYEVNFLPTEPLAPGTYLAGTTDGGRNPVEFEVVDVTIEVPTYVPNVLTQDRPAGEKVMCDVQSPDTEWFGVHYWQSEAEFFLTVAPEGEFAHQYSYSMTLDGGTPYGAFLRTPEGSLGVEEAETCYEVFATPLFGGAQISLGTDCVDTTGLAEAGPRDEIFGIVENLLVGCIDPPDELEEQWCDTFAFSFEQGHCGSFSDRAPCEAAFDACDVSEFVTEDSGLIMDEETSGEGSPESEEDDTGSSSRSDTSSDTGGCSLTASTAPSGARLHWLASLLGIGMVLSRRRRSHVA